jgi:hypothetical protein
MATTITLKHPAAESTGISTANANSLVYAEPAYDSANKKLILGSGTTDNYGVFWAQGGDPSYAALIHDHDLVYATTNHNHDSAYQAILGDNHIKDSHIDWGELEGQVSTTDIPEGTNLFYTDARADARIVNSSLTTPSDVNPVNNSDDGRVLSYDLVNGDFTWVDQSSNTDEDVNAANLTSRLADLTGTITIGLDATTTTIVKGSLQVDGTMTTINSTTLNIDDKNIVLANGSLNKTAADGAGITIDCGTTDSSSQLLFVANGTIGGVADRYLSLTDNLSISPSPSAGDTGVAKLQLLAPTEGNVEVWAGIGAVATRIILDTAWTGDSLTESQITGAAFNNWNTAYTNTLQWDGGTTGLNQITGRASLGLGTAAVANIGTSNGQVAAGDHVHTTIDGGTF